MPDRNRHRTGGAIVPRLRPEHGLWRAGLRRVVGVDEVGVAPTCGPVVAAAVIMPPNARKIAGVRDSKTLSLVQRERLDPLIRARAIAVGVGAASVSEIDRLNIYHATHLAMRRAIARLGGHDHVLVDGNRIVGFEAHVGPYTSIVDGDATCYSIACASIVAKVVRDRLMTRLAARYPGYGWEHNAGYATPDHREALVTLGPTPFHRRSFAPVQAAIHGAQLGFGLDDEVAPDGEAVTDARAVADDPSAALAGIPLVVGLDPATADALTELMRETNPAGVVGAEAGS